MMVSSLIMLKHDATSNGGMCIFPLCEKCSYWRFSGPYFPAFGLNTERYSECGKIRTRKTLNTDTFLETKILHYLEIILITLVSDIL